MSAEPLAIRDEELALEGLDVTFDSARSHSFIRVTRPNGTRRTARYERALYREFAVDALAEEIHNQVMRDREFRDARRSQAAGIAAEIKRLEAERAGIEEAARSEVGVAKKHAHVERERVDAVLRAARDTWKARAGLRPPW